MTVDNSSEGHIELLDIVGLYYHTGKAVLIVFRHYRIVGISARNYRLRFGIYLVPL